MRIRFLVPLVAAASLASCAEPPSRRPHVVLFVLDTMRADSASVNGHSAPLTPTLDGLAAEGVNFEVAYAHSTWTKPSMATLMTGTFADRHKVRTPAESEGGRLVAQKLRGRLHTMAERFQQGGWATAAFVNQVHLRPKFGFAQGFEHYDWNRGKSAGELNARLAAWLERDESRPRFLYVHYLDPHWPYLERVEGLREALGPLAVVPSPPQRGNQVDQWLEAGVPPGSIEALRNRYDHGVAYTDRALADALAVLERTGLLEDAIVAVTSDHGEGFLEHGKLQHGYAPFEEVLRVPLVVRPPAWADFEPRTVRQPVGLIDLMPTLLDLSDLPASERGDRGRSLVPLMRGERLPARAVYAESIGVRSLRSGNSKILAYSDGRVEFFDLAADPGETTPLPCEAACEELVAALDAMVELAASWKEEPEESVELDEGDLEHLRALGYLDD